NAGRIEVDLGRAVEIKQVNTYSWHPSTRGPQVYRLYGGEETADGFNASPGQAADPEKCGWKLIAKVDTRIKGVGGGGQYGVSISDSKGIIGKYRHLLFVIAPTETDDDFGNTFYSEIDVVELNAPVAATAPAAVAPLVVRSADGYAEITIDTAKAPELKDWAEQKLAPALVEWYPKIVAMMPSDGFSAPKKFSVTIRPGNGVAYTSGTRIVVNSKWLGGELDGEAVGAVIHEAVHVVQQYGNGWRDDSPAPGWLTEGIPDYIRFFKYEPQSHGADIVWLQGRKRITLNYDGMYRISANFLDYVIGHDGADKNVIQKVNAACRQGSYTDGLWKELTGKTLAELNEEWKAAVHQQLGK
ncbi:MAG TPA: basic secretory protein-like protein, partial [Verrucomicrobiae bacterium]